MNKTITDGRMIMLKDDEFVHSKYTNIIMIENILRKEWQYQSNKYMLSQYIEQEYVGDQQSTHPLNMKLNLNNHTSTI